MTPPPPPSLGPGEVLPYMLLLFSIVFMASVASTGPSHRRLWLWTFQVPTAFFQQPPSPHGEPTSTSWHEVSLSERTATFYGSEREVCLCAPHLRCFAPPVPFDDVPHVTGFMRLAPGLCVAFNQSMRLSKITAKHVATEVLPGRNQHMAYPMLFVTDDTDPSTVPEDINGDLASYHRPDRTGGGSQHRGPQHVFSSQQRMIEVVAVPAKYSCEDAPWWPRDNVMYLLFFGRGRHLLLCAVLGVAFLFPSRYLCCTPSDFFFSRPLVQTHYLPVFWQLTIFVFSVVSMYDYFRLPILAITMCYAGALDTFLFYLKHKKSHQGVVPQANGVSVGILPIVLSISLLGRWGRPGESDPHMYGLAIFLALFSKHFFLRPGGKHI